MKFDGIKVRGAKEHNLKNVDVSIPRNKITVFTGLSGSGKSSLAFDTVYAEGQRRYVESLSAYARNFLEQLKKPQVDSVTGLSPAIAIDQKSVGNNPRSTVGTITEISDFLRLLFAKVGKPLCPTHKVEVAQQSPSEIFEQVLQLGEGAKFYILAPMAQSKKGEFLAEFQKWAKKGYVKAKVDGQFIELGSAKKLAKTKAHDVDLVIDQLILKKALFPRLKESINTALSMAEGRLVIENNQGQRQFFSMKSACPICSFSFPEMEPRLFSFNNPRGACSTCHGLGTLDLVESEEFSDAEGGGKKLSGVSYTVKGKKISDEEDEEVENDFSICPDCQGSRLRPESLNVVIQQKNIAEVSALSAVKLLQWSQGISWNQREALVAEKIIKQILFRLEYLIQVGAGYLSMDRTARTLSGGEAQRIRLATQVGSSLIGVLYVMDEPSIGLHPRDHHRLLKIIGQLRDRGNTILLVEHDEDTILFADHIVDIGPRAGKLGGEVLFEGHPLELKKNQKSLTGQYLAGTQKIATPKKRRAIQGEYLEILGAKGNNLKNVDLKLPLGVFTCVTGVSGSGKSTLIIDTLTKILNQHFFKALAVPSPFHKVEGLDLIDKVIDINQRPIGRSPRSTPATYTGLFPMIRDLFAQLPESKLRGFGPGRFSFNVKGGRCEGCQGHGLVKMEMHFLSDVFVQCDLCLGKRYNRETLNIKYKEKSISDILDMSVEEALDFFKNHQQIFRKVETLHRVGLDYMTLGQSSTTLSGGEAQRVKLSKELSRRGTGKTVYILDEPTTGLHFDDVKKLIDLLQELTDQGNTVLVIEHNVEMMKVADHIIDLGPEGGDEGGFIVATGTPEMIAKNKKSITGPFIKKALEV